MEALAQNVGKTNRLEHGWQASVTWLHHESVPTSLVVTLLLLLAVQGAMAATRGAAMPVDMILWVAPASIPADGASTATLWMVPVDGQGEPSGAGD